MYKSITAKRIMAAIRSNIEKCTNYGFCKACGHKQDGCEPDARNYTCQRCGAQAVDGAEELLFVVAC